MPKAKNLEILLVEESTNTYVAKWHFNPTSSSTTSGTIKAGSKVSVKSGAIWYNTGTQVPSYVLSNTYTVNSVSSSSNAVLLGNDQNGNNINSWIETKYLTLYTPSGTASSTVSNFDHFEYSWWYYYNGTWFKSSSGTVEEGVWDPSSKDYYYTSSTVTPESMVSSIRLKVTPVSENKQVSTEIDGRTTTTETPYWIGTEVTKSISLLINNRPETISSVIFETVSDSNLKAKVSVDGISDKLADFIEFEILEVQTNSKLKSYKVVTSTLYYGSASHIIMLELDKSYTARARAYNIRTGNKIYSPEWSLPTQSAIKTPPSAPKRITDLSLTSENDLHIAWTASNTADKYTIQYTTDIKYFDSSYAGSSEINTITIARDESGALATDHTIAGINRGFEYFFRINASRNGSDYVSSWSDIRSIIIGKKPSPPTTWSNRSSAYVTDIGSETEMGSETITLYWQHNSSDGSSEVKAKIQLIINDTTVVDIDPIDHADEEDKKNEPGFYEFDSSDYGTGKIDWKVKTRGIYSGDGSSSDDGYSDWSMVRTINVYEEPSLYLSLGIDTKLNVYPFDISHFNFSSTKPPTISNNVMTIQTSDTATRTIPLNVVNKKKYIISADVKSNINITNSTICYAELIKADGTRASTKEFKDTLIANTWKNISLTYEVPENETLIKKISFLPRSLNSAICSYRNIRIEETFLEVENGSPITTLPMTLYIDYGPSQQTALSYNVSIVARSQYETIDNVGNFKMVNVGDTIYSNYIINTRTIGDPTMIYFGPDNLSLVNGEEYRLIVKSAMNTGLSAEEFIDFYVEWEDTSLEPNLDILIDKDTLSASLRPYCIDDNYDPIPDVLLSVYRRNYDGSFTEIATDIESTYTPSGGGTAITKNDSYVTDPHPALDYARYRVVAKDKYGKISYTDPVGVEVGEKSIIIQWDEEWSTYYTGPDGEVTDTPPWSGSMVKLPYNIDVSEKRNLEMSTIKYIGRKHPVSYFGTQTGETASWSTEIPKSDTDTLYSLRRLSNYMGNVYVREPSGIGYWATVSLSFGQKHRELTIPINIEIVRVEGGM